MDDMTNFMQNQFDSKRFIVQERFKYWSDVKHKPGETPQELAARLHQQAVTCDFASIKDPQNEALRTKFICSIAFCKAVEVAVETEDVAKAAKETVHGSKPTPIL